MVPDTVSTRPLRRSLAAGLLVGVAGLLAVLSGEPAVFPSLGPTAYVLAMNRGASAPGRRRVVGGHAIGVVAGLLAYHLLASGAVVTGSIEPLSVPTLGLAASAVLSVTLTALGMSVLDARHPPACATTLIVSLGLLSAPLEGLLMLGSVVVLYETYGLADGVAARTYKRGAA